MGCDDEATYCMISMAVGVSSCEKKNNIPSSLLLSSQNPTRLKDFFILEKKKKTLWNSFKTRDTKKKENNTNQRKALFTSVASGRMIWNWKRILGLRQIMKLTRYRSKKYIYVYILETWQWREVAKELTKVIKRVKVNDLMTMQEKAERNELSPPHSAASPDCISISVEPMTTTILPSWSICLGSQWVHQERIKLIVVGLWADLTRRSINIGCDIHYHICRSSEV